MSQKKAKGTNQPHTAKNKHLPPEENNIKANSFEAEKTQLIQAFNLEKQQLIDDFKNQINNLKKENQKLNAQFLEKVNQKAIQAQALIDEKTQALEKLHADKIVEIKKYALEKTAAQLVDLVDKFGTVVNHPPKDPNVKNYVVGFKMFVSMFEQLLSENDVEKITIHKGDQFDPEYMEAFDTAPVGEQQVENQVLKVYNHAYKLHERVIKFAKVKVAIKN